MHFPKLAKLTCASCYYCGLAGVRVKAAADVLVTGAVQGVVFEYNQYLVPKLTVNLFQCLRSGLACRTLKIRKFDNGYGRVIVTLSKVLAFSSSET